VRHIKIVVLLYGFMLVAVPLMLVWEFAHGGPQPVWDRVVWFGATGLAMLFFLGLAHVG
jgi:hypothetical protein